MLAEYASHPAPDQPSPAKGLWPGSLCGKGLVQKRVREQLGHTVPSQWGPPGSEVPFFLWGGGKAGSLGSRRRDRLDQNFRLLGYARMLEPLN